jgi:hypothetical protein
MTTAIKITARRGQERISRTEPFDGRIPDKQYRQLKV